MRRVFFELWLGALLGAIILNFGLSWVAIVAGLFLVVFGSSPPMALLGISLQIFASAIFSPPDISWVNPLRDSIMEFIQNPDFPIQNGMRRALLLGDGSKIPSQIWGDFRMLGLAHLLVISGSHIAVIAALMLFLLKPLCSSGRSLVLCRIFICLFIGGFALLCSGGLPVARAAMAFGLVWSLGTWFPRILRYSTIDRLAMVGLVLAFLAPAQVVTASYALTFGASLSLLWLREAGGRSFEFLIFPSLFVAPICQLFGLKAGIVAPVANLIGIPVFEFVLAPLSMVGLLMPPLQGSLEFVLGRIFDWIHFWATMTGPPPSVDVSLSVWALVLIVALILKLRPNHLSRLLLWASLCVYHLALVF